nr:putative redox protein fmp46, mitochondrial [Quercus suber]
MSFFKKLFKENGIKDVVTLFHAPSSPASMRAHTILKQAAAQASAHATEDQASDHAKQSKLERAEFTLEVTEEPPTSGQLSSILEYLGSGKAGTVVSEANDTNNALEMFKSSPAKFQRPVIVDWNNGRAVVGDDESEILKLVKSLPKETGQA